LPRLPAISAKAAIKALDHLGFKIYRQTGSHIHLWNEERNLVVTVPNHPELAEGHIELNHEAGEAGKKRIHCCLEEIEPQVTTGPRLPPPGARSRAWGAGCARGPRRGGARA